MTRRAARPVRRPRVVDNGHASGWLRVFNRARIAGLLLVVALYVVVATVIGSVLTMLITGLSYAGSFWPTARVVLLGLASIAFTAPAIVLWLRWLERR